MRRTRLSGQVHARLDAKSRRSRAGSFGLIEASILVMAKMLLMIRPLATDPSRWYAWQSVGTVLVLLTPAMYAFRANLGR